MKYPSVCIQFDSCSRTIFAPTCLFETKEYFVICFAKVLNYQQSLIFCDRYRCINVSQIGDLYYNHIHVRLYVRYSKLPIW